MKRNASSLIRGVHLALATILGGGLVFSSGACAATLSMGPTAAALAAAKAADDKEASMPTVQKAFPVTHNKTRYAFAPLADKADWLQRRDWIREHIRIAAGLWPEPPRGELKPKRLDRKTFDGYVREKIYFQSYPGVLVTGALYAPADAKDKLPGVLCPHGHWKTGRLEEPVQARCINFAKQGYVVLAIDMVGYNDNGPIGHGFQGDALWGLSLGGLQLWNCIRSLDLLASLENVDPQRIGVTGASGGGTQTFMVSAIDERVKVAAPVCMISAHFQGGCLCENVPLMRVRMNNMEIGAAMAPRPLVLVSATGDWTKNTPEVESPAIRRVYELMGATKKLREKQFDLGHNYDKVSRQVVYAWFARWLKDANPGNQVEELPYQVDKDLRIFTDERKRPDWVKSEGAFVAWWRETASRQLDGLRPKDATSLKRFRETLGPALRHVLCVEPATPADLLVQPTLPKKAKGLPAMTCNVRLGLRGRGAWLKGQVWMPSSVASPARGVLVVHPKGAEGIPNRLIEGLVEKGRIVLAIDCLPMGVREPTKDRFYYVYNRSNLAIRVQEILLGLAALSRQWSCGAVDLVGLEQAGPWVLLARAVSDIPHLAATVADARRFDDASAAAWRSSEMFNPAMLRVGGTSTAGGLIAPAPLLIHNAGDRFRTKTIEAAYAAAGARGDLRVEGKRLDRQSILDWLTER